MPHKKPHWLRSGLIKSTKLHLLLIAFYAAQIIAYDASKLITPEQLKNRWFAVAGLLVVCAIVWYLARSRASSLTSYKILTWLLIVADILFAAFNVYQQRGMASRAVLLFFIPLILSSILLSRVALIVTALLSIAAYTSACIAYFVNYFNEGYKIELYGEILFYSAMLMVAALMLWVSFKSKHNS